MENITIQEIEAPMIAYSNHRSHLDRLQRLLDQYRRGLMTGEEYALEVLLECKEK